LETLLHGWCAACLEIVNRKSEIENEMVRLPGIALGPSPWHEDILRLSDSREN